MVSFLMVFFCLTTHPFFKSLGLLAICMSFLLKLISFGGWLNYILSLIYLGGILILFIYVSSLLPLWNFKFSSPGFYIFVLILIFSSNFFFKAEFTVVNFSFFSFFSWIFLKFFFFILFYGGKSFTESSIL